MQAPLPPNEPTRLSVLRSLDILDSIPEESYDRIVNVASQICDTPVALFSLVDEQRQWFKARIGMEAAETSREVSFCAHAVAANEELLVTDATQDQRFFDNALVIGSPNIRFYFGVPVRVGGGQPLGTLCVIDSVPRTLTAKQRTALVELAREVEVLLELRRVNRELTRVLEDRAVMASMIAHDARNLMTRLLGLLESLGSRASGDDAREVELARGSVQPLLRMCENFVELNRGRVAPELEATIASLELKPWFENLAQRETHRARGESAILDWHSDLEQSAFGTDAQLLERITLNLLDNAYRASPEGGTVRFHLSCNTSDGLLMTVEDEGAGVPDDARDRLFEPFFSARPNVGQSSGLGLAFCRLAATALGGHIDHSSPSGGGARFQLRIPNP